jgi:hypothetical protein
MLRILAVVLIWLAPAVVARAEPPDDVDPGLSSWYQGLKQPGTRVGCCSTADCRPVPYRIADDHYEAFIDERWVAVPADKILDHESNPTGRAVACWTPSGGILCFVRPTET